jgi:tRNA(adenine34) deaminase
MEFNMQANDEQFMRLALKEAQKAFAKDEVPVGAVAVKDGKIVARAHNIREMTEDPFGHAEILLLGKLSRKFKSWRLPDLTIYVTLQPCSMCRGAFRQARIKQAVFGAKDSRRRGGDRIRVRGGVLAEPCSNILVSFFRKKRLS